MDPNATLRLIAEDLNPDAPPESQDEDVIQAAYDLLTWISNGGYPPHWAMHREATRFYADFFNIPYSQFYGVL